MEPWNNLSDGRGNVPPNQSPRNGNARASTDPTHPLTPQPLVSQPPDQSSLTFPSVGAADLDPLAAAPSIMPGPRGVHLGGTTNPRVGGDISGGGMHVGPGHPLFGRVSTGPDHSTGTPFAGPQRLPPGAVPSGARFDPVVPFGPNPNRGPGGLPRPPTGNTPQPWSGEPDQDEFLPPAPGPNFF
ncbi:hypothetical protein IWQ62_000606 [Dispira parvispora]|uniref:PI31 proteasome regulator C-terminal domain-containing protein n=1 Tax=Dispira parvispora TaxID=1520584 RepID=A0A9W8E9G8_9FUNG|nr:hypothetical protein IWQ62_000606 [Dispira parvispora]